MSQITQDSAIISWTTDEESDSKVNYDAYADSFRLIREDTQLVMEHRLTLIKLEPGKVYQLVAESKDKAGNPVRSRPFAFETLLPADKENPSVSLILPEKVLGKKVIIRADARDNTGVDRITFYFNGKPAFTDFTAPFEWEFDATIPKEGTFNFGARAFDATGNMAEAVRDGEIHHHFSDELSPVKVRIFTPTSGEEVYGMVGIAAEISDDADLGISYIEFRIDEDILSETNFDPPFSFTPILSPMFITNQNWDSTGASRGDHVISVRVRDESDNWGNAGIRVRVVDPPTPSIDITRDVQRIGNYFEVTLTLRNSSPVDVSNLMVADTSHNFQSIRNALWRRGESGSFNPLLPASTVTSHRDRYGESTLEMSLGVLRAGETKALRYYAVPVLTDPGSGAFASSIGYALLLSFEVEGTEYSQRPSCSWSSSELRRQAFQTADYLLVTCPTNLFDHNAEADVSELLSVMAQLAKEKNGVLGYITSRRAAEGAQSLKNLIQYGGRWSQVMTSSWVDSGYLLIVGETEIIPAWTWEGVPLSDFPYGDTKGDERLELRVGRIIGNTATDLAIPIRSSLQGVYDGSHALLAGGPEDTWEPNVMDITMGQDTLERKGVNVQLVPTEYWTTDYIMFAEALRIRKAPPGTVDSAKIAEMKELAKFLLRYLGPPRGANPGEDLSGYSLQELIAWLLWARNFIAPTVTKADAINDALIIVNDHGGVEGAMWGVMQNMLMRGESDRLFTTDQLAAWLLWEETTPRGPLSADTLGSATIGGVSHQLADMTQDELVDVADVVINPYRMNLAKERAEAVQANNPSRGGISDPWHYTYVADLHTAEMERSAAIKRAAATGKDLILFCGHGDPGGWCAALTDWIGSGSEIEPINFGGTNPIVAAFSCDTGNYQQSPQTDVRGTVLNPNPSISEKFLKNGATVYMGATVPMLYSIMDELIRQKFWNHWSSTACIGDIMVSLKTEVFGLPDWWQPFNYYYNLYGDPKFGQR